MPTATLFNDCFALSGGGVQLPVASKKLNDKTLHTEYLNRRSDDTQGGRTVALHNPIVDIHRHSGQCDVLGLRQQIIANVSFFDGQHYHGSIEEWEQAGGTNAGLVNPIQVVTLGEYPKIFALIYTGSANVRGIGEPSKSTVGALSNMLKTTEAWVAIKFRGHAATVVGVNGIGAAQPVTPITPITPITPLTLHNHRPANHSEPSSQSTMKPPPSRAASLPVPKYECKTPTKTIDRPRRATDLHEMLWGSHFMRNPNYHSEFPENNDYHEFEAGRKVDDGDNSHCFNPNFKSEAKSFVANAPMYRGKPAARPVPSKGGIDRLYF